MLILSQYLETRYATRLLEDHPQALGYLLKECVSDIGSLKDAIQRIAEGECVLWPREYVLPIRQSWAHSRLGRPTALRSRPE